MHNLTALLFGLLLGLIAVIALPFLIFKSINENREFPRSMGNIAETKKEKLKDGYEPI
jgi:ABC-type cobalt transport system substrate-binding protein